MPQLGHLVFEEFARRGGEIEGEQGCVCVLCGEVLLWVVRRRSLREIVRVVVFFSFAMAGSDVVPAVVEGEGGGDEAVLAVSAVENSSKGGESKAVTVKEKKVKIPKEKKPKSVKGAHASSTAAHPSYLLVTCRSCGIL